MLVGLECEVIADGKWPWYNAFTPIFTSFLSIEPQKSYIPGVVRAECNVGDKQCQDFAPLKFYCQLGNVWVTCNGWLETAVWLCVRELGLKGFARTLIKREHCHMPRHYLYCYSSIPINWNVCLSGSFRWNGSRPEVGLTAISPGGEEGSGVDMSGFTPWAD